jgi:hypothetical protein
MAVTDRQLEIIREIQRLQASLEKQMDDSLPLVFKDLSNQVIELTNDIPLDPKNRAANIRAIISLKNQIAATISTNPEYIKQVQDLVKGFREIKNLSDSYFSTLIDGYNAKEELYQEILKANISVVRDRLIGGEIKENFKNAITEVLNANAAGQTNRTELQKVLKNFIEGTPQQKAYLERYIKQTTSDSIMGFSREYNQTIATDLNLQYYFYAGTLIEDSRQFCKARAGRYFKKSEVQSWAKLKGWDGRMPGTNEVTIFSFLGGFGCRHDIYPITKTQYLLAQKRGLAGLK